MRLRKRFPSAGSSHVSLALAATLAVVLAGCASPTKDLGPTTAAVRIHDLVFDPDMLEVAAGAVVEWRNEDDVRHTVTPGDATLWGSDGSGSSEEDWLEKGETYRFRFDTPGTYEYYCIPHGSKAEDGTLTGQVGRVVVRAASPSP